MSKNRFHTHSLLQTHTHTHPFGIISYGAHLFLNNLFFIILPLVCFVLSVTFVCFVFWTYENSISILCKQTTTLSVITIGSLPIHLPSPTILLSLTRIHTHSYTYILALIYTAIKRFSWFFIVLFYQCFFSIIFGLKLTNIGPHSTTSTETKVTAKISKNKS